MSDKELRTACKWIAENEPPSLGGDIIDIGMWIASARAEAITALETAPEPDVVVLAKQEEHWLDLAGGSPKDEINPYDPLSQKGIIWWRGYRQARADTLSDLQQTYHFRLTDDGGWEYTE